MRIQVDTTVLVEESGKLLLPSSHYHCQVSESRYLSDE